MGGRAGGGARGGGGGGFGGKTERGLTKQEARTLLMEEAGIRANSFETAIIVDKDGNIVFRKVGDDKSVSVDYEKMKDRVLTHNHPATTYKDPLGRALANQSFSDKDIIAAVQSNAKGIRVITQGGYRFSLMRPEGGWGVNPKNIGRIVAGARRKLANKMQPYFNGYKGGRTNAVARAEQVYWHMLSKELSSTYGWKYTKSKIK